MNYMNALSLCTSEDRIDDLIQQIFDDDSCFDPMPILDVRSIKLLTELTRNRKIISPISKRLGLISVSLKLLAKNHELAITDGNMKLDDIDSIMDKLLKLVIETLSLIGKTGENKPFDRSFTRECNNFCYMVKELSYAYIPLHKRIMANGLLILLEVANKNLNVRIKNILIQLITRLVRMEQIDWSKEFMDSLQPQMTELAQWVIFKCGDHEAQVMAMAFICLIAPTLRDDRRRYAKELFRKRRSICKQYSRVQFRSYNGNEVRHFLEMINDARKYENKLIYSMDCMRMIIDGSIKFGPLLKAYFSTESKIIRAEYSDEREIRYIDIEEDSIERFKLIVRESTEMYGGKLMICALVIRIKKKYYNCIGEPVNHRKIYLIFNGYEEASVLKSYVMPLMFPQYNTPELQNDLVEFLRGWNKNNDSEVDKKK